MEKGYRIIEGDEVNSFHAAIMRELNVEQMVILRDKLIQRTPLVNNNLVQADVIKSLPLDFVKWYSGMEHQKILNAYERWKKESGNGL